MENENLTTEQKASSLDEALRNPGFRGSDLCALHAESLSFCRLAVRYEPQHLMR